MSASEDSIDYYSSDFIDDDDDDSGYMKEREIGRTRRKKKMKRKITRIGYFMSNKTSESSDSSTEYQLSEYESKLAETNKFLQLRNSVKKVKRENGNTHCLINEELDKSTPQLCENTEQTTITKAEDTVEH